MNEPKNKTNLEEGSGIEWVEWVRFFEPLEDSSHTEMARAASRHIIAHGSSENPDWWAQSVTAAYEQSIGRRLPGQRADGSFEWSITKSVSGSREEIFERILQSLADVQHVDGMSVINPRMSLTEKRSFWRCNLSDGSKTEIAVGPRPRSGYMVSVTQSKVHSEEAAERWRKYWRQQLGVIFL